MSEQCMDSLQCDPKDLRRAMSIHTRKITDACRDKDCIEDLRVYLTTGSQSILDSCASARVRCAQLLHTAIGVEPVAFDPRHYCIDATFYYRILADAVVGSNRPAALHGLAVFSKRAVLCGEAGCTHLYRSDRPGGQDLCAANLPTAVVEVLDPMVLGSRIREACDCSCGDPGPVQLPGTVCSRFDEELVLAGDKRRLFVSLGQFSVIRLERDAQLIVPVLDYSLPDRDCTDSTGCAEDPCEMFSRIPFPEERFVPRGCCEGNREECGYRTCGG